MFLRSLLYFITFVDFVSMLANVIGENAMITFRFALVGWGGSG